MTRLFLLPDAQKRDPGVEAWLNEPGELRALARTWFERMRQCGPDVRESLHDGMPTACVGEAAFGYVTAFKAHVNVGLFPGAELSDPTGLLEGSGKFMRHAKLRPGIPVDEAGLEALIAAAYRRTRTRLAGE